MDSLHSATFWVWLLHGDLEGCREFGCYWPFDPRPLHHRDQLQGSAPFEHSSQHGHIMNTASNEYIMAMISMLSQYTRLQSPGEKPMTTPTSCFAPDVSRLNSRHLGSFAQLLSSALVRHICSLLHGCFRLFQAADFQSVFQKQDSMMVELRRTIWDSLADRIMSAEWRPGERAGYRDLSIKKFLERLKGPDARGTDAKSPNTAGRYSVSPSSNLSGGEMWCLVLYW